MAKIIKSELLEPDHPIYVGEWTVSSHKKRTLEPKEKYKESKKTHVNLIVTELTLRPIMD